MKHYLTILMIFLIAVSFSGLSAKPEGDRKGKPDHAVEKSENRGNKGGEVRGKDRAAQVKKEKIQRIDEKISRLKEISAELKAEGNTEKAEILDQKIAEAEKLLEEKKEKVKKELENNDDSDEANEKEEVEKNEKED